MSYSRDDVSQRWQRKGKTHADENESVIIELKQRGKDIRLAKKMARDMKESET